MIEAELKARVKDVEAVRTWLRARAEEEEATYHDTYYDWPDHRFDTEGREVRLRTVVTALGKSHLLTYKQPVVDAESASKPEYETLVSSRRSVDVMLRDLGLIELISLSKQCLNYKFETDNRPVLVTLVKVPELTDSFIEVETQTEEGHLNPALRAVRRVLVQLDLSDNLEPRQYTDMVLQARKTGLRTQRLGYRGPKPAENLLSLKCLKSVAKGFGHRTPPLTHHLPPLTSHSPLIWSSIDRLPLE